MQTIRISIAVSLLMLVARPSLALDHPLEGVHIPPCCSCAPVFCYPNDYCPKPIPCIPCVPMGCCNDYCCKPLPCVPCSPMGCCNDYCRKPLPCLCWPAVPASYRCDCK